MYRIKVINGDKETIMQDPYMDGNKIMAGSIKEGINVAENFTFSILPNNPAYNKISPLKTLVIVENTITGNIDFDGYIFMHSESMSESGSFIKSFTAVGELGYLKQTTQTHGEYHDITIREFLQIIINNHNKDIWDDPIDKQFILGEVNVGSENEKIYRYLGYEDTLSTIKDKLLDRLGGELRVRKENGIRYLDYVESIGGYEDTEIRIAENLQSISKEADPTDIITRLRPLGARIESEDEEATDASEARITIDSVNDGKDYIVDQEDEEATDASEARITIDSVNDGKDYIVDQEDEEATDASEARITIDSVNDGKDYIVDQDAEDALGTIIMRSETWDDINEPSNLKSRGLQFLQENNRLKIQYNVSALDLNLLGIAPSNFKVGFWYPVYNPAMNINERLRIIGKTTDLIEPEKNGLTIGDEFKSASDYQLEANKGIRMLREVEGRINSLGEANIRLSQSLKEAKDGLTEIQDDLININFDDLPVELQRIGQKLISIQGSIADIDSAIAGMPNYAPANSTKDGLLTSNLYMKLIAIDTVNASRNGLMLKEDKIKLDKITVIDPIDLDDLLARIKMLEGGTE